MGFHSIREVGMMTRSEYELRMEVYQLQELDAEEKIAKIAFYNQLAQSTTGGKNPRAKYDKFDKLFNRQEQEYKIRKFFGDEYAVAGVDGSKSPDLFAKRMKEFERLKKAGRIDKNAWKKVVNKGGGR